MSTEEVAPQPHRVDLHSKYVVAVVAFVATLFGALAGAGGAIIAANVNANAQRDVARQNFDRQQRVDLYLAMIDNLGTFYDSADSLVRSDLQTSAIPNQGAVVSNAEATLRAATNRLLDSTQAVLVVGSTTIRKLAVTLENDSLQAEHDLLQAEDDRRAGKTVPPARISRIKDQLGYILGQQRQDIVAAVRAELY